MAETVHESAYWFPSDVLTDDDFFFPPDRNLAHPYGNSAFAPFLPPPPPPPPLFRRSSSALNSPNESVVSSTETDTSADDPDEFIADLARHLALSALRDRATKPLPQHHHSHEKAWGALATSPQSTLSGFESWTNRRRAPPASDDEALELIYAAVERVAKMRLCCQAQMMKQRLSHLAADARTPPVCYNAPQNNHHQFQQIRTSGRCGGVNATVHGLPHSSFPPLRAEQHNPRHHNHAMRGVYLGGSTTAPAGIKKQSTGTGVFLPRRVGISNSNNSNAAAPPTEPRNKQGGCSTVLVPARVVQALNLLSMDDHHGHTHTQTQPCFPLLNHDTLVARRNGVIMGQQQQRGARGEPFLPQEWTY